MHSDFGMIEFSSRNTGRKEDRSAGWMVLEFQSSSPICPLLFALKSLSTCSIHSVHQTTAFSTDCMHCLHFIPTRDLSWTFYAFQGWCSVIPLSFKKMLWSFHLIQTIIQQLLNSSREWNVVKVNKRMTSRRLSSAQGRTGSPGPSPVTVRQGPEPNNSSARFI